jgi:hypothetical protein
VGSTQFIVGETLRGLAQPRRAVAIAIVAAPMLAVQATEGPGALLAGIALIVAAIAVAPASWRVLGDTPRGVALYAALGVLVIWVAGVWVPGALRVGRTFLTAPLSLATVLGLYWIGGWGLGRDVELSTRLEAERERAEALTRQLERAELLAIRSHLDPHFVFNTLNAIAEWCAVDPAVAEAAILKLAELLRVLLVGTRAERWPLAKELELVTGLFELYRLRDPERFRLEASVDPRAGAVPVPPLVLLVLAENAIKHGPAAGHEGPVTLSVVVDSGTLQLRLENPGPFGGPRDGGEGLATTEQRLRVAYGGSAHLSIRGEGPRTVVELSLP